jgi:putative Mg2+ transporter-C (MgtC) family protein
MTVGQASRPCHSVAYPPMNLVTFGLDVAVALLLGVAIGTERQFHRHPAGLRTNALVCVGSALFVSLPRWIGGVEDPTRMASMVVSGLGFLGGGVILREGLSVKGLNTAATLWCSGAVGALTGAGFPLQALIGTVLILGINLGLRRPSLWIDARRALATDLETCYRLRVECEDNPSASIRTVLLRYIGDHDLLTVQGVSTDGADRPGFVAVTAEVVALEQMDREIQEVMSRLSIEPGVRSVSWKKVEHAAD